MFITLPSPHPPSPRSLRRYPLTPPTVAPPSVNTLHSSSTRQSSDSTPSSASARATALLSKVVSSPASRRGSQTSSPVSTPAENLRGGHEYAVGHDEDAEETRQYYDGYDAIRYWTGHEQRDGYISFPDFERFRRSCEDEQDYEDDGHNSQRNKT